MTPPATPAPKPTLFISYASEDREAVRRLRDSLAAAGLDVWYDENELGGGDAWDQKIRRQIRDCDYFMPVISANTVRRKEGYFRREWRLATERTLDMADDVMFLLPVCIDGTSETNARVPEKFLSVQWLRAPDGVATPALETLARRLAAGEHLAPTPPRGRTEPPLSRAATSPSTPPPLSPHTHSAPHDGPPPMPAFPQAHGNGLPAALKFFAEVIWWVITAAWLLLRRAPRWARVLILAWMIITLFSYCGRATKPSSPAKPAATQSGADKPGPEKKLKAADIQAGIDQARKALSQSGLPAGLTQFGDEMAKRLAAELKNSEAAGKEIVAIPFNAGVTDAADAKFLADVFTPLWGRLSIERAGETALIATPLPSPTNAALVALGQRLDATYVLGARLVRPETPAAPATADASPAPAAPPAALIEVALMKSETGAVAWSENFPLIGEPAAVSARIAEAVLAATKSP